MHPTTEQTVEDLRVRYAIAADRWCHERYLLDHGRGDYDDECAAKAAKDEAFDAWQSARQQLAVSEAA